MGCIERKGGCGMRLIECNIKGFGGLKDFRVSFDKGVNVIMQPNGWGKTTLAAFIKAMLYGFENKRVRDVSQNERLRYLPWNGGVYGGTMDFESKGIEYRIIRKFGKTPSGDSLKVINIATGEPVKDMQPSIGEWLFGIDSEAFRKSVFVSGDDMGLDISSTGLRNRLNSVVNEAEDVRSFDDALKSLDIQRKEFLKARNGGSIADFTREIERAVERLNASNELVREAVSLKTNAKDLGEKIDRLSSSIDNLRKELQEKQKDASEKEAALSLREKLSNIVNSAEQELKTFENTHGGTLPDRESAEEARRAVGVIQKDNEKLDGLSAQMSSLAAQQSQLKQSVGGRILTAEEIENLRSLLDAIASANKDLELLASSSDSLNPELEVLVGNPDLVQRGESLVSQWGDILDAQRKLANAEKDKAILEARLADQKQRAEQLTHSLVSKRSKLDTLAGFDVSDYAALSARLRSLNNKRQASETNIKVLTASLNQLGDIPFPDTKQNDIETIDAALHDVERTAKEAARLKDAKMQLEKTVQEKSERQKLASGNLEQAQKDTKHGSSAAPSLICVILGCAMAAVGAFIGFESPVALILCGTGAVLIALAIVLFVHSRSNQPDLSPLQNAVEKACKEKEDASDALAETSASFENARNSEKRATDNLFSVVSRWIPDCIASEDIVRDASLLKGKLASSVLESNRKEMVSRELSEATTVLEEVNREVNDALSQVPHSIANADADLSRVANALDASSLEIKSLRSSFFDDLRNLSFALQDFSEEPVDISERNFEKVCSVILHNPSKKLIDAIARADELNRAIDSYRSNLTNFNKQICIEGSTSNDLSEQVGALRLRLDAVAKAKEDQKQYSHDVSQAKERLSNLTHKLHNASTSYGIARDAEITKDYLQRQAEASKQNAELEWRMNDVREDAVKLSNRLAKSRTLVKQMLDDAGIQSDNLASGVLRLEELVACRDKLRNDHATAVSQLNRWDEEHAQERNTDAILAVDGVVQEINNKITGFESERKFFIEQRAHQEERLSSILDQLEDYLNTKQGISLLSHRRQIDSSRLFTVQNASKYLKQARSNLDGRYLGDLSDRFTEYADSWIAADQLCAEVDENFSVFIEHAGQQHDLANYSTGYRDLLEICFRMALTDALFVEESPFLVMDDPFASLDEEKISKALQMLNAISDHCQIIYFTCHPSRLEDGSASYTETEYVLPAIHKRRELPRQRAMREAEERARKQAELVASFVVVPVTSGRTLVRPASQRKLVSSNLLSIEFEPDYSTGVKDNEFSVYFIDEKGRALCERQTVSVIEGSVIPQRVRFNLSTKEDSGKTFELIIHEEGRPDNELADRIPFQADIAFANDLFA